MSADKKKTQVTLKRRVGIKAVVTDKFKEFLHLELQENVRNAKAKVADIDAQKSQVDPGLAAQLEAERTQLQLTIDNEAKQKELIDQLENESIFNQGAIDGFVGVSIGDNLYEKLGGMEILVKDGVVEKITPVSKPLA